MVARSLELQSNWMSATQRQSKTSDNDRNIAGYRSLSAHSTGDEDDSTTRHSLMAGDVIAFRSYVLAKGVTETMVVSSDGLHQRVPIIIGKSIKMTASGMFSLTVSEFVAIEIYRNGYQMFPTDMRPDTKTVKQESYQQSIYQNPIDSNTNYESQKDLISQYPWLAFSPQSTKPDDSHWRAWVQGALDIVGLIPVLGGPADLANACMHFAYSEPWLGVLSLIAVVPGVGEIVAYPLKQIAKSLGKAGIHTSVLVNKMSGNVKDILTRMAALIRDFFQEVGAVYAKFRRYAVTAERKLKDLLDELQIPGLVPQMETASGPSVRAHSTRYQSESENLTFRSNTGTTLAEGIRARGEKIVTTGSTVEEVWIYDQKVLKVVKEGYEKSLDDQVRAMKLLRDKGYSVPDVLGRPNSKELILSEVVGIGYPQNRHYDFAIQARVSAEVAEVLSSAGLKSDCGPHNYIIRATEEELDEVLMKDEELIYDFFKERICFFDPVES